MKSGPSCALLLLSSLLLVPAPGRRISAAEPAAVLAPAPPTSAAKDDPALWPEAQRAFFQDGPALLLSDDQRSALVHMDVGARQRWIDDFLARGSSGTPLKQGIERRHRLAAHDFVSPADVRAQLLFLNGTPSTRTILDCGTTFKPLEVWTYVLPATPPPGGTAAAASSGTAGGSETAQRSGSVIVYRPTPEEPFRAWTPNDSKRVLYTSEMEYWLEQWEELRGRLSATRLDLKICKQTSLIDRVTGIAGLTNARGNDESTAGLARHNYGLRPDGAGEALTDPPSDLARWARQAADTKVAAAVSPLAIQQFDIQFPAWSGQRIVTRAIAQVTALGRVAEAGRAPKSDRAAPPAPAGATATTAAGAGKETSASNVGGGSAAAPAGKQLVGITVEGVVENAGRVFESFRVRYRLPPPAAGQAVSIALERHLRPGRAFVLRLRVKDDGNGAETDLARGFVVPPEPIVPPPAAAAAGAMANLPAGEQAARERLSSLSRDTVTLLPPADDVVFGLWRAEALVTGNLITKVAFTVDDKLQFARHGAPYSVELRLKRLPSEQVVRADGFDDQGHLVASDQLVLNQPHGGLSVAILDPARGSHPTGKVQATAEVTVPSERRVTQLEFRVNDAVVATLKQPPWTASFEVPKQGDTVYLTVSAQLDDGARAEDVRFLRSPNYVEEVSVNLVELYTTVVDDKGQLAKGLTAGDFQVFEGTQPQNLAKFELVENLPLTLGILIDTSGSMASSLGEAQRAAGGFLERMVRPGDRCFTLTFSDSPVVRMPLTDDPRAAAESISHLQADGSTSIHDALVHSLYYFRGTHGQRALVLLSDGDDNTSQLTFDEALEYAKRSGVAIYTIGLKIPAHNIGIRGKLGRLSELTGGKVFFVSKAAELAGVYEEIETELRSRYLLAFQSGVAAGAGGYRQIDVKMKKPGLKARTARGYYP